MDKKEDGNDFGKDFIMDDFDAMFDKDSEIVNIDVDDCKDFKFQTQMIIKCEEKNSSLAKKKYMQGFLVTIFCLLCQRCYCLAPQCSA